MFSTRITKMWRCFVNQAASSHIRDDLSKGGMIFSEESSRAIYEMANMELTELTQTSATIHCLSYLKHVPQELNMCQCGVWRRPNQSTMDRIRTAFAALKTPNCRTTVILSRGRKSGHNQWQVDHQEAMDARRGATKRHEYTSILDRWQNDERYRASWMVHGLTGEWVMYFDYISKIDIIHEAPTRIWKHILHETRRFQ